MSLESTTFPSIMSPATVPPLSSYGYTGYFPPLSNLVGGIVNSNDDNITTGLRVIYEPEPEPAPASFIPNPGSFLILSPSRTMDNEYRVITNGDYIDLQATIRSMSRELLYYRKKEVKSNLEHYFPTDIVSFLLSF